MVQLFRVWTPGRNLGSGRPANREVAFALIKNEDQDEVGAVPIMVVHNEIGVQVPADQAQEWLVKAKADGMKECL